MDDDFAVVVAVGGLSTGSLGKSRLYLREERQRREKVLFVCPHHLIVLLLTGLFALERWRFTAI